MTLPRVRAEVGNGFQPFFIWSLRDKRFEKFPDW
jgi:hypothetical protein